MVEKDSDRIYNLSFAAKISKKHSLGQKMQWLTGVVFCQKT